MISRFSSNAKQHAVEFIGYLLASLLALAVDYSCYWFLAENHILSQPTAAVVGYLIGLIVAYLLIAGRIFQDGWLKNKKHYELMLFLVSGILGTALTYLAVLLYGHIIRENVHEAKIVAIGVSFTGVYAFRKLVVFRRKNTEVHDAIEDVVGEQAIQQ